MSRIGDAVLVLVGVAVIVGTTSSLVRTIVVPQGLRSALTDTVMAATRWPFQRLARTRPERPDKERAYTWAASISLLVMLVTWVLLYVAGYGLLLAGLTDLPLASALRVSGSSLTTLGFAAPEGGAATVVGLLAGLTGPLVITLLVAYLPTLYSAYNRREMEVTLLAGRAGEPSWGPELLARHRIVNADARIVDVWLAWERWAAEVSETHTSYPMLIHVRSPRPLRSWLTALLSVLDSAALHLALNPADVAGEARVCLRAGIVCLRDLARVERIPFDEDPDPGDPVRLTYEEFLDAVARLREVGYPMEREPAEAWTHFRGWRVNYEPIAYALAYDIDAPPALWSGPRRHEMRPMPPHRPENRQPPGTPALEDMPHARGAAAPDADAARAAEEDDAALTEEEKREGDSA